MLYDITCLHRIQLKIQFKWYIVTGLVQKEQEQDNGKINCTICVQGTQVFIRSLSGAHFTGHY